MSGPVTTEEALAGGEPGGRPGDGPRIRRIPARATEVGGVPVRRALPRRALRTVGAWCFVDHFGPVGPTAADAMQVGPHPHIGLQTVTWLLRGEVLHTDGLGSEQPIRPGQLNLMTAGGGVAHAESARPGTGGLHGVQLWVAQPEATRHGPAAFAHHPELPQVAVGPAVATVLVGTLGDATSPAGAATPLLGVDLAIDHGTATLPLDPAHEHALVVLDGSVLLESPVLLDGPPDPAGPPDLAGDAGGAVRPGELAHLGTGRAELVVTAGSPARALLLGGQPLGEELLMWWNFVARTRAEVDRARADWEAGHPRYGAAVPTDLDRIPAPPTPWTG